MFVRRRKKLALGASLVLAVLAAGACSDHNRVTTPRTLIPSDALRNISAPEAPVIVCKDGPIDQLYTFNWSAATTPVSTGSVSLTPRSYYPIPCSEPVFKGTVGGMVPVTIDEQAHAGTAITDIEIRILDANGVPLSTSHVGTGPSVTVVPTPSTITAVIFTNRPVPPTAKLGDFVWDDKNANGLQDAGDAGIGGVTLTLTQGSTVVATTTTDASGKYLFDNLVAGCYDVTMTAPTGWLASPTEVGPDRGLDSNGNPSTNVCLAAGEANLTIDFGLHKLASLGDFVWQDDNNNGIQDVGEPGIGGSIVTLSQGGTTKGTATTDAFGHYLFSNLVPGCYDVSVPTPTGFLASPSQQGADRATDSNGSPANAICLGSGEANLTIDFGFVPLCTDPTATNYNQPGSCEYPPPPACPSGSFTYTYLMSSGDLFIKFDQFPAPNDNSYGINAVGWPNGHKFSDLTGSDHAGFQLVDGNGVVKLSFNVDYLHASATAPSGYASLGVLGGDGKMLVGTADGITATTSLANNLNNINIPGLFNAAHVQQFGSVNLLVNSPPTDPAHQTYNISDPLLTGWDFHDTYFVTISAAKLASLGFNPDTWKVQPNLDALHNSPAKPCPPSGAALLITKYEVKDKQVKVTIQNTGTSNVYLTDVALTWPSATNGKLMQIKLDGDVVYDTPDIAGGTATLTLAQLVADQNKRKIDHGTSDVFTLIFEKNADPNLAHYTGSVTFSGVTLVILPK